DLNDNVAEVRYDELGVVTVTASHGLLRGEDGALVPYGSAPLADYAPIRATSLEEVIADPARFLQGASTYFCYDIAPWTRDEPWPPRSLSLAREAYVHDGT